MNNNEQAKKIKLSDLAGKIKPKTKIFVKGEVDYSHIATKIAGEELARANQYTQYPSKDPYYKMAIQLTTPEVKDSLVFNSQDMSEATLAAYIATKIYASKKEELKGKKFFSAISKGNEIRVYKKGEDGKLHRVNLNGNELGQGCKVELELNYFESKYGPGVGLNAVIIDGEIKVYEGYDSVKGYEMSSESISLPARQMQVVDDVAAASGVADETPVSDVASEVEVDNEPIGSTAASPNEAFEAMLSNFITN